MDTRTKPIKYIDPINGKEIPVRSVYTPQRTLLQGAPYSRKLKVLQRIYRGPP